LLTLEGRPFGPAQDVFDQAFAPDEMPCRFHGVIPIITVNFRQNIASFPNQDLTASTSEINFR
jgi:hypothetical protein